MRNYCTIITSLIAIRFLKGNNVVVLVVAVLNHRHRIVTFPDRGIFLTVFN